MYRISHYSPIVPPVQSRIYWPKSCKYKFNLSALSFLLDPDQIAPNPDPGNSSGWIHNTASNVGGCGL